MMHLRSIRLAYAVPPLLAFFLGFVGVLHVSDAGLVGVRSVVTAASDTGSTSNRRVAASLERVALAHHATIVRVVADRRAPTTRRTALVTAAPSSRGAAWLQDGYRDFAPSMRTRVLPMSALDRFDTAGRYDVIGDDRARRATEAALTAAGFEATSERIGLLAALGVADGLDGSLALIGALALGAVTLCLAGTIGAPRRIAIRRLHGSSTAAVLRDELAEVRTALVVLAGGAVLGAALLPWYNGLAAAPTLAASVALLCIVLLAPVVLAHALGTIVVCRRSVAETVRGARGDGAPIVLFQATRAPAVLLVVAAVFDLAGAWAVVRVGNADRDLRAAGDTVQLWVTPDAVEEVQTQAFWDRIGAMAGVALERHDALLTAAVEVSVGAGAVPALFVDAGYLDRQDVRAADGSRITAGPEIGVWTRDRTGPERRGIVDALRKWELRGAPAEDRARIGGGELGSDEVYTYPGDSSSVAWLSAPVLVVVPDPARVFDEDQLGSWISTGDVVFGSTAAADRAVREARLHDAISAVVAIGQAAAEEARGAGIAVATATATVVSGAVVAVVLGSLATAAHRRRFGRRLFAEVAAGRSFLRANATLLTVESVLLGIGAVVVLNTWWDRRPDGSGRKSMLDPVARSAEVGGPAAAIALALIAAVGVAVVARSARPVVRCRGNGS